MKKVKKGGGRCASRLAAVLIVKKGRCHGAGSLRQRRGLAATVVDRWVSHMELPDCAKAVEELVRWGVATPSQLKPLALRYWCGQYVGKESRSPPLVAYFLREAYVADLSVELQQEKKAETFLYNFEAAKRGSYAHKLFTLAGYYRGGSVRGVSATVSAFPQTDIVKDNQVSKVRRRDSDS